MAEPLDPKALEAALAEYDRWDEGFTSSPREYQVLRCGDAAVEIVSRHNDRGKMEADLKRRRFEAMYRAYISATPPQDGQSDDALAKKMREIAREDGVKAGHPRYPAHVRKVLREAANRLSRPAPAEGEVRERLQAFIWKITPRSLAVKPSKTQKIARRMRAELAIELQAILDNSALTNPPDHSAAPSEPSRARKHGYTVNLTEQEMDALEALAKEHDLPPWRVLLLGLRLYQLNAHPVDLGPKFDPSAAPSETVQYTYGHCKNYNQPGGCQEHNLHCGYPDCDRRALTKDTTNAG